MPYLHTAGSAGYMIR